MPSTKTQIRLEILDMIASSSSLRKSREYCGQFFYDNQRYLDILFECAFNVKYEYHYKACWILELVADLDLTLLVPRLQQLLAVLPHFHHDGALRSISRICMLLCEHHQQAEILSESQNSLITDVCFEWLLGDQKVATKAYAMRTLLVKAKSDQSVVIPLKDAIQQGFPNHSAGYKSAAKDVLRQLSRFSLL